MIFPKHAIWFFLLLHWKPQELCGRLYLGRDCPGVIVWGQLSCHPISSYNFSACLAMSDILNQVTEINQIQVKCSFPVTGQILGAEIKSIGVSKGWASSADVHLKRPYIRKESNTILIPKRAGDQIIQMYKQGYFLNVARFQSLCCQLSARISRTADFK